jgi:hypothetical protein
MALGEKIRKRGGNLKEKGGKPKVKGGIEPKRVK